MKRKKKRNRGLKQFTAVLMVLLFTTLWGCDIWNHCPEKTPKPPCPTGSPTGALPTGRWGEAKYNKAGFGE